MHSFTSDVQMIHSKAGTILEKITWVAEGWGFGGGGGGWGGFPFLSVFLLDGTRYVPNDTQ